MKARFVVQFSGWYESGNKTDKKFLILNIYGEVSIKSINDEIEKLGGLSSYRRNKDIDIHYLQAF